MSGDKMMVLEVEVYNGKKDYGPEGKDDKYGEFIASAYCAFNAME
jgi:hypothetical protein